MNILVTGACGFIGSHLVEKLVKENHNVRAFTFYNSRNSHGWLDNVDKKRIRDKNSEVYRLYASNTKAAKILKWRPKYSGLKGFKKGLEKTINWFSEPKNLKYYNSDIYNI